MNIKWFTIIGLCLDMAGVIVFSYGLIISKKEAIELGVSRICGDDEEENLKLPQVQDSLKKSKNTQLVWYCWG